VVADLDVSFSFYINTLKAKPKAKWSDGAYLELGTLWLCLERGDAAPAGDDTHIAITCAKEDFDHFSTHIAAHAEQWKENRSEGRSLYFRDPDGHKLELHVGSLRSRLAAYRGRTDVEFF